MFTIQNNKANQEQVAFIDKFIIPENAMAEFLERANYNRAFIKNLEGFVKDNAYQSADDKGNVLFATITIWESSEVLSAAKDAVQAEYKRININPAETLKRLGITMDRAVYKEVGY